MAMQPAHADIDVAIVGGGAAGLATAIFTARASRDLRIAILDGAAKLGAKILVSGGGRCNVTNRVVTANDYWGGSGNVVRRILASLPVEATIAFFDELGVRLHEEEFGKLFPNSNKARSVVDALIRETERLGIAIRCGQRVEAIRRGDADSTPFTIETQSGVLTARAVVLATGGLSLPKSGSDGGGYELAKSLGHHITPTVPALAPLLLNGDFHVGLAGVACDVELRVVVAGEKPLRLVGPLLWTHFGVSGPVVLNASRHWAMGQLARRDVSLYVNFFPARDAAIIERDWMDVAASQPRQRFAAILSEGLPARLVEALLDQCGIDAKTQIGNLSRERRREAALRLTLWPLPVRDTRGYTYAEVTAGGIALNEIEPSSMQSRCCDGLFLVGEILDVDGRLGGFNFQWAWSGAFTCANGISKYFSSLPRNRE